MNIKNSNVGSFAKLKSVVWLGNYKVKTLQLGRHDLDI